MVDTYRTGAVRHWPMLCKPYDIPHQHCTDKKAKFKLHIIYGCFGIILV